MITAVLYRKTQLPASFLRISGELRHVIRGMCTSAPLLSSHVGNFPTNPEKISGIPLDIDGRSAVRKR